VKRPISQSMSAAAIGCFALAGFSLLFAGAPSYDPMSWLVWGREIVHFNLSTVDGPSWKPLPVAFTTVFALFGGAAPWLWLVVARAGALLGLVLAYRIASRLAGTAAGVLAASALVLSRGWFWSNWIGYSEGLLIALCLWALDRHLERRYRQALVFGFLAALLRPEVWPFVAGYGIWLWRRRPDTRPLIVPLAALVPLLWLGPELIGSGDVLRAAGRAREPTVGSGVPALDAHPWLALLKSVPDAVIVPVLAGFAFALLRPRPRPGVDRVTLALAGIVLAWIGLVAAMTQAGFTGNPRYLIAPAGIGCVVAGVGWARLGGALFARLRFPTLLIGTATVLVIAAASLPWARPRVSAMRAAAPGVAHEAELQRTLPHAIRAAGGRERLVACGPLFSHRYTVPRVAWALGVHLGDVRPVPGGSGLVIQARRGPGAPWLPVAGAGYRTLGQTKVWRVVSSCGVSG
jgi:hypothetical protein